MSRMPLHIHILVALVLAGGERDWLDLGSARLARPQIGDEQTQRTVRKG
jgi:hypothetical protein